jgi:dihydrofolate reductase
MRKLKLQMQVTLDGFVGGPNGENDWVFIPGKQDPAALQATIDVAAACDTILAGRKMVAGFSAHWQDVADNQPDNPWNPFAKLMVSHRKIAFSRTETAIPGIRNLEVENGDLATVVQALKNQPGKDILVYGGAGFASSLISLDLVDEYYFVVNPVAIGAGLSIFKERKILKLESTTAYTNGKLLNIYVPVRG